MKILSKGTIAAMVAGTFIMAAAASPFIVQASEIEKPAMCQQQNFQKHQITPEQIAQHISDTFGMDKATILEYNQKGMNFKDIGRAAFLASASGKSFDEIISHKTADNNWKDVATTMGITKEEIRAARQNMIANRLTKNTGLDKQVSLDLLQQGYHAKDIGIANELAKNTNKPINEILSLKKINNRWSDVATTLGVDKETFKNDLKNLGQGFGFRHKGHSGPHFENKSAL